MQVPPARKGGGRRRAGVVHGRSEARPSDGPQQGPAVSRGRFSPASGPRSAVFTPSSTSFLPFCRKQPVLRRGVSRGCGAAASTGLSPSCRLGSCGPGRSGRRGVGPGSGVSSDVTDFHSSRQNRPPNPFDTGPSSVGPDPVAAAAFGGETAGGERHRPGAREAWTPPKGSARRPLSFLEPSRGLSRPCPPHRPPRPPFPSRAVGAGFALGAPLRCECSAGRGGAEPSRSGPLPSGRAA